MVTFEAGSSKYLNYLKVVKNASEHTLRNYSLDLTAFNHFFDSKKPFLISAVDKRSIRAYLAGLAAKNASKKTILRRLSSLRSFFKFLVKERLIEHNPLDEVDSPKLEKKNPSFRHLRND